jgi:hypothetical protein
LRKDEYDFTDEESTSEALKDILKENPVITMLQLLADTFADLADLEDTDVKKIEYEKASELLADLILDIGDEV